MFHELIFIFLLSLVPCCFGYFLDYCLGQPMSNEPKTKEIFFFYSYWLAERRVKKMGLLHGIYQNFIEMLQDADKTTRLEGRQQLELTVMLTAQKYFSWEKAFGMCIFCTNFWLSEFAALAFYFTIPLHFFGPASFFLFIPIISHSILRKL